MTDQQLREITAIKIALDIGFTLDQIKGNPRDVEITEGAAVEAAADTYGPGSPEVQRVIDKLNERAVIYTTARAAYRRVPDNGS